MKKVTRIMMIAAVAVAGLSAIVFLISLLFQRYFIEALGGGVDSFYFMVPVGYMISCFGGFGLALGMLFVVCNDRVSLKVDAICAGLLAIGVPFLSKTASYAQSYLTNRYMAMDGMLYYSQLLSVTSTTLSFMGIVTALTLIASGMSIAVKYLTGKSDFSCK